MKHLAFAISLFMAIGLLSCATEEDEASNSGAELVVVTKATASDKGIEAFKGSDVKSFNSATREIIFKELTYDEIMASVSVNKKLSFYLDNDFLFDAFVIESDSSGIITDLIFYVDARHRMYLIDGYAYSSQYRPGENREAFVKAWERFIQYLDENNLLINEPETPNESEEPVMKNGLLGTHTLEGSTWRFSAFEDKDVLSFNPATREIVFESITGNLVSFTPTLLSFYLDKGLLFDATAIASDRPVAPVNDLVFFIETKIDEESGGYAGFEFRYYLLDGYPSLDKLANKEEAGKERESAAQKRKVQWDRFIQYLTDKGKIK
jgi:hypothetical protein